MSRLEIRLAELNSAGRKALVPYIVSGDGDTEAFMGTLVAAGADILELGMPFSDPMAEGQDIQQGHQRALANGETLNRVLQRVANYRQHDQETPIVLMGYLNPIESMGYQAFAQRAHEAGVDAVLVVDMPHEESMSLRAQLTAHALHLIPLVAPTTSTTRAEVIMASASAYVYSIALKGVTGAGHLVLEQAQQQVERLKALGSAPVVVGFGIKTAEQAGEIARVSDGVVVGSHLVRLLGECHNESAEVAAQALQRELGEMRSAMDRT